MAAQIKPSFFFVLAVMVALGLSSSAQLGYAQPAGDFRSFCQKTDQVATCIQTIDSFTSNKKLKVDAPGWLQILKFKLIAALTLANTKYGDAIRSKPPANVLAALQLCQVNVQNSKNLYAGPLDFTAITHDQYVKYNNQVGSALNAVSDCQRAFEGPPAIQNPVAILTQATVDDIILLLEGINIYQCNHRTKC